MNMKAEMGYDPLRVRRTANVSCHIASVVHSMRVEHADVNAALQLLGYVAHSYL